MDPHQIMPAVLDLASRLGIEVRQAPLGGEGGGLCTLKGNRVLFVDVSADVATQCAKSLADLAQLAEIDTVFVSPDLREALDAHRFEG